MNLKTKNFIEGFNYSIFSRFLLAHQWINDGKYNKIFTIWHRPEEKNVDFEIIVPEYNNIKFFYTTIEKILNDLSDFYGKTHSQIIDDFNNSIHDKVKYSIKSQTTKNGLIPLNEGIRLLDSTKEMLASTFMAVSKKKKNYIGQRYESVNNILEAVELGQTEEGSFIINIFIPRDYYENRNPPLPLFEEPTYTRKALCIMESAVKELLSKIEEYQEYENIEIFNEIVEKGVSSNFCHAISEISSNGKNDILINIEYNDGIDKKTEIKEISINKEFIPVINKVVEYFRSDMVEEDQLLRGYVTMLHQEEDAVEGEITLATWIEGKRRKVRIKLNSTYYIIAVNAHRDRQQVVCRGTLSIQDRIARLLDVSSVLISDDDE
jgi:hypothetical protein